MAVLSQVGWKPEYIIVISESKTVWSIWGLIFENPLYEIERIWKCRKYDKKKKCLGQKTVPILDVNIQYGQRAVNQLSSLNPVKFMKLQRWLVSKRRNSALEEFRSILLSIRDWLMTITVLKTEQEVWAQD